MADTTSLKLVSYNIQFYHGRDGAFDPSRIVNAIQGADLISLQEVERYWVRSGNVDQVQVIADALHGYDWAYGPTVEFQASQATETHNPRPQFGNMTLSRWPLHQVRRHLLPKRRAEGGRFAIQRGIIETLVETLIGLLRLFNTHLDHLGTDARLNQRAARVSHSRRRSQC